MKLTGKYSFYELNDIYFECGCNAHYACGKCGKCFVHSHRNYFSKIQNCWYWQCENKTIRRANFYENVYVR